VKTENEVVLTVQEVADYLRVAQSTVYRLAKEGKLPGRKIGGMWRFSKKELDRWVKKPSDRGKTTPEE
jgi:excisionase family DNA binding protein